MNYRIFLVEDDRSIADGLRHQLEQWDFAVQVVQNFRGVLGEFTAFDPHLVLMDIMLPCYDGYHWCREIRQVSQVPIIFLSSASDNMNLIMAMNMGGDNFIAKPLTGTCCWQRYRHCSGEPTTSAGRRLCWNIGTRSSTPQMPC